MSIPFKRPQHQITLGLAVAALASWGVALWQALPRLLAGPLCSSPQDAFSLAGHCPACFVAAFLTLAFLARLTITARTGVPARQRAR